ncbi:hypothetical protein THIOSC15_3210005 [uncultured Thiomicrorhabdus sp.]
MHGIENENLKSATIIGECRGDKPEIYWLILHCLGSVLPI